jgi:hypothetical protein
VVASGYDRRTDATELGGIPPRSRRLQVGKIRYSKPSYSSQTNPPRSRAFWRSDKALIDSYGEDATIHAAMRAAELLAQGDLDGAGTWLRVLDAVKALEQTEPGGAVH